MALNLSALHAVSKHINLKLLTSSCILLFSGFVLKPENMPVITVMEMPD
jgi:hypothetical protein